MAHTVKAVSKLASISVRTLHHYDAIGLLTPEKMSCSGYRLYTERDLEQLQQILFFRELGFSLQEIKEIISSPDFNRKQALLEHRQLLLERQERLSQLIVSVDRTINAIERGIQMDEKEMFDGFDQNKYEEEARQRWGHTKAYQESTARAKQYTKDDWDAIKQESGEIIQGIASLMECSPSDPQVQEWIRKHHQQINDRFYTCSTDIYRGLAEMYVQDERFTAFYEKIQPGLAKFVSEAMLAYCDQLEGK